MNTAGQTVIVSHRLPWRGETDSSRPSYLRPNYIGLTKTLDCVLRSTGGTWIGISHNGDRNADLKGPDTTARSVYSLAPVLLGTEERTDYQRFSNGVLWPLLYGLAPQCTSAEESWSGYCKVNGRIAEAIRVTADPRDFVWVHDYPLIMTASMLRASGWQQRIGYFHHVPFPQPATFQSLPWRFELLHGLLQFDLIGFQKDADRWNFADCIRELLPLAPPVETDNKLVFHVLDREIRVGTYPVGIDYGTFSRESARDNVIAATRGVQKCVGGTQIVLGVGPLDPMTGICESLTAFEYLLERNPELRNMVTMIQIAVPCNHRNSHCWELDLQIEAMADQINRKFGSPDWKPVHYYHRQLSEAQMIAFYRSADVALVTPLHDGVNLAAKEFCASKLNEQGVLILTEGSGAAEELRPGALRVNPRNAEKVAMQILRALRMSLSEQMERMAVLRSLIRENDVFKWSVDFQSDGRDFRTSPTFAVASEEASRTHSGMEGSIIG